MCKFIRRSAGIAPSAACRSVRAQVTSISPTAYTLIEVKYIRSLKGCSVLLSRLETVFVGAKLLCRNNVVPSAARRSVRA